MIMTHYLVMKDMKYERYEACLTSDKSYLVIKLKEVEIVNEVMACDILPVAKFYPFCWICENQHLYFFSVTFVFCVCNLTMGGVDNRE